MYVLKQDLFPEFGSECNESQSQTVNLSNDSVTVTPLKRQSSPMVQVVEDYTLTMSYLLNYLTQICIPNCSKLLQVT